MTEPQSNKPITAAEAFEAAGENLRQAEKAWSDTRVPDALLGRAIDIANAWTALGVGLSNAEPFDAKYPIPIKLVGEPLEPVRYFPGGAVGEEELMPRHLWPSVGPQLCKRCGVSMLGAETPCVDEPVGNQGHPAFVNPARPHVWDEDSGLCVNENCRAHQADGVVPLECAGSTFAPPHVHDPLKCHHAWIRPTEPCANGCGTSTREKPSYCPKTCPDVTA